MARQQAFMDSDVLTAAPEAWPIPQEVAGIKLPDSTLARQATEFTRACRHRSYLTTCCAATCSENS